jgi:CTP-dependent riboflavin kinase
VSTDSGQLDETLKRMKQDAEKQLAALKSQQFAVFEVLPNGDSVDRTTQQISTLEKTVEELNVAIEIARKVSLGSTGDQFQRVVK